MKTSARITGGDRLLKKLKAHPQLINRTVESILTQEARALCIEYGSATMPGPGMQENGNAEAFRNTVEADVKRVFASRDNPSQVYELMKIHAPHLAAAYWHAHKAKKTRSMAEILRRANLPEGLNRTDHKAARTGKNGRVKKNQKPVTLANAAQLRVFVRGQRRLVGFAKAGWLCAAKGLGGRVRGSRGTTEAFPKYVRALARKYPDAGGARLTKNDGKITIEIFTNVRHAVEAIPPRLLAAATSRAQAKTTAALTHAVRALNQKQFQAA